MIPQDASRPSQPQRPTGAELAAQQSGPLGEFTLDLAKAMLRTGYYAPDHPQAQQSRAGLYEQFRRALGNRPGITYLVGGKGDNRSVMIEGYDAGVLQLDQIMIHGMAELFAPKLLDFFARRHLLSFSLRAGITAEEFEAFVVLMSEPPRAGKADEERDRVTRAFLDQHIIHVSTLFEADVLGRERRLPWRVERALSRLGRDLSMLPLYKRASPEKIQEIKIQIIDEVIRPLRTPKLLMDLLVNCDVLARDIAVLEQQRVEHEIIAQTPHELLVATTRQLMEGFQELRTKEGRDALEDAGRYRLMIRHILDEFGKTQVEIDGELVEAVVDREIFNRDELPESLKRLLQRQRVVGDFLSRSEAYLKALRGFPAGDYGGRLDRVARLVFPQLLRKGHYREAAGMLEALGSGGHQSGAADTVRALTEWLHERLATEANVRRLLEALRDEKLERDDRDAVITLLSRAGTAAAPGLQEVYTGTESVSVRTSAFETMKRIGRPALEPFLKRLPEIEPQWSAIHHILAALDDQTDPALAESIKPFLRHENAHVRHAALTRVFELLGPESQDRLIRALSDPDPGTRHAAVAYLGQLESRDPKVLAFYARALRSEGPADAEPEHDDVLLEVCKSLASVGETPFPDGSRAEGVLLDALRRVGSKKRMSRISRISGMFQKPPPLHGERVRVAICRALGAVGTPATAAALRELAADETEAVAEAARAAAGEIGRRRGTGSESSQ